MSKKKTTYGSLEDLIHDQVFVNRIKKLKTEDEWQNFLKENLESKEIIRKARKFIDLFEVKEEVLEVEKKQALWIKIKKENQNKERAHRVIQLRKTIGIAASFILIISLSSILYLSSKNKTTHYEFVTTGQNSGAGNPVLKLSNGDEIEVEKDESQIAVLDIDNSVKINNDTIQIAPSTSTITEKKDVSLNELIIPFGKKSMVVLSDGTKVWLNAGSKFAFPQKFDGKKRKVYLDGEGYFEVAKNEEQPFIVISKNMNIEVLGTKFNVNSYSSDKISETVLLEGSVKVWNDSKLLKEKLHMSPNQKATFLASNNEMTVKSEPDVANYIFWIDGLYKFKNENLEQVFIKVGRYYNMTFVYQSEQIRNALPLSGKLDLKESFEEVMNALSKVAKIEYKIEEDKVIIN